ncbi:hypothetical protein HOC67_01795 [Candidatus Peregrinibacteria bacterium]|nr:hypothetical protein [Candidatus Peregrinibacteria bacterium]
MSDIISQPEKAPNSGSDSTEIESFLPTPDVLSGLLGKEDAEIFEMYINASKRAELVDGIMEHEEDLCSRYEGLDNIDKLEMESLIAAAGEQMIKDPSMQQNIHELREILTVTRQSLAAERQFLEETDPNGAGEKEAALSRIKDSEKGAGDKEKRSLWKKAWDVVTWMPRNHPIITTILAIAAISWGAYVVWGLLSEALIIPNPMTGAAEVAETVVAPTGGAVTGIPQAEIALPNLPDPSRGSSYLLEPLNINNMPPPSATPSPPMPDIGTPGFFERGPL